METASARECVSEFTAQIQHKQSFLSTFMSYSATIVDKGATTAHTCTAAWSAKKVIAKIAQD